MDRLLTERVVARIEREFRPEDRAEVVAQLRRLPVGDAGGSERVQFAAIQLAEGDPAKLPELIDMALHDWRDLLYWAEVRPTEKQGRGGRRRS